MTLFFVISCMLALGWSLEPQIERKQTIELPYDDLGSSRSKGVGYSVEKLAFLGNPFVTTETVPMLSQNVSLETQYTRRIIKDFKDYSEMMSDAAFFSFAGWGFNLRMDFFMSHKYHFTSYDALFVLKAAKDLGFEGWASAPSMTEDAKKLLCSDPDTFKEIYGDYYMSGVRLGSALEFYVKIGTFTTRSEDKVSVNVSAGWSGWGVDLKAGNNFTHAVNKSENYSSVEVWADVHGVSKTFLPGFTATENHSLDELQPILDAFNKASTEGAGIALVLKRYDDHPDYIAARTNAECKLNFHSVTIDENFVNKITGIAVQALLMESEIMDKTHVGGSCVTDLAGDALRMFQEISDLPLSKVSLDSYLDYDTRLQNLRMQWDPVNNACATLGFHRREERVGTCMETNVDYWGHDLKRVEDVRSALDCMKECQAFFGCNAWTWTKNYCWLKTSSEGRAIRMMLPFKISGTNTCADCFERQYEYFGNDLATAENVKTAEGCQEACKAKRGCSSWTFKGIRGDKPEECLLKYSARGRQVTYEFPVMSGPATCAQLETETCMVMGQAVAECFGSVVTSDGHRVRMGTKYAFTNEDTQNGVFTWECNDVVKENTVPGSNLIEVEFSLTDMKLHWTGYSCFPNEPITPSVFLALPVGTGAAPSHCPEKCTSEATACAIDCTGEGGVEAYECKNCLGPQHGECAVCIEENRAKYLAFLATGQNSPIHLFKSAEGCCNAALRPQAKQKECDEDCCAQLCEDREGCQGFQARLKMRSRGMRWSCKLYDTVPELEYNDEVCLKGKRKWEATCYAKME